MRHRSVAVTLTLAAARRDRGARAGTVAAAVNGREPGSGRERPGRRRVPPGAIRTSRVSGDTKAAIPLERPARFEGRESLTDEEVERVERLEKEQEGNDWRG